MSYSLTEVLTWFESRVANEKEFAGEFNSVSIDQPSTLESSHEKSLSFFFSLAHKAQLIAAKPGILITGEDFVEPMRAAGLPLWKNSVVVATKDPYYALAVCSAKFASQFSTVSHVEENRSDSIHPSAVVSDQAKLGKNNQIGANVTIDDGATIGDNNVFYPGCYVGKNAKIGSNGVFFANVSIYENVRIGDRVRLHSGVVLGADGFGYAPVQKDGKVVGQQKIYHFGSVRVGNDVEIGANSCVDRGTFSDSVVGDGVKIDNHVQIGHNCEIGEGTVMCGKSGIAGSVKLGKFVTFGGGSVATNKVEVGDRGIVAGVTFLSKNVGAGEIAVGYPQKSPREFKRLQGLLNRMLRQSDKKRDKKGTLKSNGGVSTKETVGNA